MLHIRASHAPWVLGLLLVWEGASLPLVLNPLRRTSGAGAVVLGLLLGKTGHGVEHLDEKRLGISTKIWLASRTSEYWTGVLLGEPTHL
jgi:hypothetical protein